MKKIKFKELKKELPGIKKNILLKNFTTFRIGGRAQYFFTAKTKEDLIQVIKAAKKFDLLFFIFGRGSNLLVSDKGYSGLVVKIQNSGFRIQNSKIVTEAGTMLGELLRVSAGAGLSGLEWAAGIPGTVGGAIFGNAGAFGKSMADIVESVEVLQISKSKIKNLKLKNKDCKFGYRDSVFKHANSPTPGLWPRRMRMGSCRYPSLIILSVILKLKKRRKEKIKNNIRKVIVYRQKTQPLEFPSAGSIFKNLEYRIQNLELLKRFPELKDFNQKGIIPAGYLIEKCGLKGKRIGNARVSLKHANFILNLGKAKANDVKKLMRVAKKEVKKKFKMDLKEEITILSNAKNDNPLSKK